MVFVADDLGAWLVSSFADAGRRKITTLVVGSEQDRALRQAATAAVQETASELRPGSAARATELARVVSQVFDVPATASLSARDGTVLEGLQAAIAARLTVLDDASLTGIGESSAEVLGVRGDVIAQRLTSHLVRQIVARGAQGGPLEALAAQLNHDVTHLQSQQISRMLSDLSGEVRAALARRDDGRSETRPPTVVFEARPRYPSLEFSVVNAGTTPIQVTALRIVKAASIKAEYSLVHHLMGPRLKLEFDLRSATRGRWAPVLAGQVSNLGVNEGEAFEVELSAENTINLVDIELEYVSPETPRATLVRPSEIIFVSAPYWQADDGDIQLVARSEALSAVLEDAPIPLGGRVAADHPEDVLSLFLRGAAYLCFGNLTDDWSRLREKFGKSRDFGSIAASFAELGRAADLPPVVREALETWVSDPDSIRNAPRWDNESHALIVQEFVVDGAHSRRAATTSGLPYNIAKWFSILDSTLDLPRQPEDNDLDSELANLYFILGESSLQGNRADLLRRLISHYGERAVEYLVVNLRLAPLSTGEMARLISSALGGKAQPRPADTAEQQAWEEWWHTHRDVPDYSGMPWRAYSPRLTKAAATLFATASDEVPDDREILVRLALVRNSCLVPIFAMELARDPEDYIRRELAENNNTPTSALAILAQDSSSLVRRWVASNPNTGDSTLDELSRDESEEVRSFLSQNPRISQKGSS